MTDSCKMTLGQGWATFRCTHSATSNGYCDMHSRGLSKTTAMRNKPNGWDEREVSRKLAQVARDNGYSDPTKLNEALRKSGAQPEKENDE